MRSDRVYFGTRKIQKLRRISLDQALLENLGVKQGDSVRVEYDAVANEVVIRSNSSTNRSHESS